MVAVYRCLSRGLPVFAITARRTAASYEGQVPQRRIGQRGRRGVIRITEDDLRAFMEAIKMEQVGEGA